MTKFQQATQPKASAEALKAKFGHLDIAKKMSDEDWKTHAQQMNDNDVWLNDTYQVNVTRTKGEPCDLLHLSIKRIDKQPIRAWRDLQQIKNEIVGPEYEGVELFPAESRLADSANQYHIWVIDDPTYRFPFGFQERFVLDGTGEIEADNSRQEPFKKRSE
jgi:hypothetical protein